MGLDRRLHLGSEKSQARVLGAMNLVGAANCAAVGWFDLSPGAPIGLYRILAVVAICVGGLLLIGAAQVRGWAVQVLLSIYSLTLGLLAAASQRDVAVVSLGNALIVVGLCAGYFFTGRWIIAQLAWAGSVYLLGATLSHVDVPLTAVTLPVVISVGAAVVLHRLTSSLRHQAGVDPLTGVATRKKWSELVVQDFEARPAVDHTVVVIDLDDFKAVNDRQGHAAGDRLLAELTAAWRAVVSDQGVVGRLGGDEFAVHFPNRSVDETLPILERLRQSHEAGWTVGVAQRNRTESLTSVLARADDELRLRKLHKPSRSSS